jgi:hypothetical protein
MLIAACWPASSAAHQLRGTVLAPNFQWPAPYGVSTAGTDREARAACSLGSTVTRVMVSWPYLEPSPGTIDPGYEARVDRIVGQLSACHIKVELAIGGTPCWDTTDPLGKPTCTSGTELLYPPRSLATFGDTVAWSLARWGPHLAALEVWNEPNNAMFWRGSVAQYVALVNQAVDSAHAIGSPVPIIAGALAGADTVYLSQMYAAGMRGQSGISMHPYTLRLTGRPDGFFSPVATEGRRYAAFRSSIVRVHRTMLAAGDPGGIWLTEFGYPVCPATPYCVSKQRQSRWLVASLRAAARLRYVRAAIIYSLRDAGIGSDWNFRFGLLDRNFHHRPSFTAVQREFRTLSGHRHKRR